jgi:hypothetical protein
MYLLVHTIAFDAVDYGRARDALFVQEFDDRQVQWFAFVLVGIADI